MKLALLAPRASGLARAFPSGGDLYDLQLARALERRGHTLDVLRTPIGFDADRWSKRLCAGGYDALMQDELGHADYLRLNASLAGRIPSLALVHVTRARLEPEAQSRTIERAFLSSVDGALFVSRQVRRETERLLGLRVPSQVAHPGCDHLPLSAAHRTAAKRLRFLCAGHVLPHKGQLELIEAFANVRAPYSLAIAGDLARERRYATAVRQAARALGSTQLRLLGPLGPAQLARALARTDVFVSASAYESYGIAVAEAQAAGLPVVAWADGGLWEFLTPNVDALRVRLRDTAGLTRALTALCKDPKLVLKLQRGARESARDLPRWDDTAQHCERLLRRVSSSRARAGSSRRALEVQSTKARRDAA